MYDISVMLSVMLFEII